MIFSYQWLRRDKVVYVGVLGGVYDLVHWGRSRVVSVRDVLEDGRVKEDGLLRYETELRTHPFGVEWRDVDAVQ